MRAIAPVAAEIMAGRPPVKAIVTAMVKDAKRPTRGSTPARIEKEMASGISAIATRVRQEPRCGKRADGARQVEAEPKGHVTPGDSAACEVKEGSRAQRQRVPRDWTQV